VLVIFLSANIQQAIKNLLKIETNNNTVFSNVVTVLLFDQNVLHGVKPVLLDSDCQKLSQMEDKPPTTSNAFPRPN